MKFKSLPLISLSSYSLLLLESILCIRSLVADCFLSQNISLMMSEASASLILEKFQALNRHSTNIQVKENEPMNECMNEQKISHSQVSTVDIPLSCAPILGTWGAAFFLPSVTCQDLRKGFLQIQGHQNKIKPEVYPKEG